MKAPQEAIEKVQILRRKIRFHEHLYYVINKPEISDYEFDSLLKELEKIEDQYPELVTDDSPTRRVGSDLVKSFRKINHTAYMLSIENSYNLDDLYEFERRCREIIGKTNIEYVAEPKIDGVAV
ncbi:MAG: hypothetical protein ABIA63_01755, partial [bacterium]